MSAADFVPLRTDPPPELTTVRWIRTALALAILATSLAVLATELGSLAGRLGSIGVAALHAVAVALLVLWSDGAIGNVDALLPATRYTRPPSRVWSGVLWIGGCAAPLGAAAAVRAVDAGFAHEEAFGPTALAVAAVAAALLLAWLPFRSVGRQAGRIGAPTTVMFAWFWAPLATFVGGLALLALATRERPGPAIASPAESVAATSSVGVGAVYALAVAVFAWSTWRAVTVFDEVIDLRWQRWRVEWERTIADMIAQPAPPPGC